MGKTERRLTKATVSTMTINTALENSSGMTSAANDCRRERVVPKIA